MPGYPWLLRTPDGGLWQLMTRSGGNDPDGTTGVVLAGSGSGCRYYPFPHTAEDRRRMLAGTFQIDRGGH